MSKTQNICASMAVYGIIAVVLFGIIGYPFVGNETLFKIFMTLMIISAIVGIIGCIGIMLENEADKNKHIENKNIFQREYDDYTDKLGIVKSDTQATLIDRSKFDNMAIDIPHYLWIENNNLNLFPMSKYYKLSETSSESKPDVSSLKLISIPIESILYFEEIGELRQYVSVSGGGSSLKGALLGYMVAEDIGAIIGSREPIKTELISRDDRIIELIYKNENNDIENLEFLHDAYKAFKQLIPSKELRKIVGLNTVQSQVENNDLSADVREQNPQTIKDKLRQLNELKTEGLITEEDFLEQKNKILNSI